MRGHDFRKKNLTDETPPETTGKRVIEENLLKIYENVDGSMPDMTTFTRRRRVSLTTAFAVLILVVGGVLTAYQNGWLAAWDSSAAASSDRVALTVDGPTSVRVGDEVTYTIAYQNNERVPLGRAELQLRFPDSFVFSKSSLPPNSGKNNSWPLGSLAAGVRGELLVTGRFLGTVGTEQSLRVFLNYVPANFSSEFQKIATGAVRLSEAPVQLAASGPTSITAGNDVTYAFTLAPVGNTLRDFVLQIDPGLDFTKKGVQPGTDANEPYRWTFKNLTTPQTVTLTGVFAGNPDATERTVVANLLSWGEGGRERGTFTVALASTTAPVVASALQVEMAINGATDKVGVAPGDTLATTLLIKNTSGQALPHVRVRLLFDAPSHLQKSLLNWAKLDDTHDGTVTAEQLAPERRRGSVTWTEKQVVEFASLAPGKVVSLDVRIPLKNADEASLVNFAGVTIDAVADVQYDGAGGVGSAPVVVRSNAVPITLNSDLAFEVREQAGQTADGRAQRAVTWLLTNSFHELTGVTLEADLYGDVTYEEIDVPAGKVSFDATSKKLRWVIDRLPTNLDSLAFQFKITVNKTNPTQSQLMSKVHVTATDTATGGMLIKLGDEIAAN